MLRSEHALVRYDYRRMTASPDRLTRRQDAAYLTAAERMIACYRAGVGTCRQELHRAVEAITRELPDCPPRRTAAFCKLLDDQAEYHASSGAAKLRKRVFQAAAPWHPIVQQRQGIFEHDVVTVRGELERELKLTWEQIERSLFADVIELQILQSVRDDLSALTLLSAYNVGQTQALLYRMIHATLHVTQQAKRIVRQIKLAGLMHRIEQGGGTPPRYRIWLDGPQSNLRETTRYGIRIAQLIPTLLQSDGWHLEARVRGPKQQAFRMTLSPEDGLSSPPSRVQTFDSALEQEIDAAWQRHPVPSWTWEHESELLGIGQKIFTPDFVLRHTESGRVIHVEVVGFWTPEYLEEKRTRLQEFLGHPEHQHRSWLLILSEKLRPAAREAIESLNVPILIWKKGLSPEEWIETALRQRPSHR